MEAYGIGKRPRDLHIPVIMGDAHSTFLPDEPKKIKNGGHKMEQSLIKTMQLSNGLELDFYDISRKLAGDRWYERKPPLYF
jgi:hypothetical protein